MTWSPARTFYNEVCKKLATFVVNARSIQEIRNFCGVADDTGFTPQEFEHNLQELEKSLCLVLALPVSRAPPPPPPSLSPSLS